MQPASSRSQLRRRSILDVTPQEIPWHWHALALLLLVCLMARVINESAVMHRHSPETAGAPRIDINYGTREELEALPGIGPALARTVIASRPYASAGDLARVRGIGSKQVARLLPLIKASQGRRSADQR